MVLKVDQLTGAPADWTQPTRTDGWSIKIKVARDEQPFQHVDNPGSWDDYCYQPAFDSKKENAHNEFPRGEIAAPKNSDGERLEEG